MPNTATLTFKDQAGVTKTATGAVSTRIVEPKIAIAKSHVPIGAVSPDQVLDFKLRVSANADTAATYFSPAHDVVVVDTLPVGTDPVDSSGNPIPNGGTVPGDGGVWNSAARTITWTKAATAALARIDPGVTVELGYRVRLEHNPVGGTSYINTADATTTSLDGSVPGIRSSTSTSTTAPDYKARSTDIISVVLPTISKDVAPDPITIGNPVTWHVHVTVPAQVRYYDTTVIDTVPDGFDVDGYGAMTCVSGCLGGDPTVVGLTVANGSAGTRTAAWYLGDLAPSIVNRVYDLVLKGHLSDTYRTGGAKVLDGQSLTNSAVIKTNRSDKVTSNPTSRPVDVRRHRGAGDGAQPRQGAEARDHQGGRPRPVRSSPATRSATRSR